VRNKVLTIVVLIIVAFVIASFVNSYWETLPYASYSIGDEIIGVPFPTTSMTINGYSTASDTTFPESSTDIYVNVTIRRLDNNQNPSRNAQTPNKHLYLNFQSGGSDGGVSARNDPWNSSDTLGITTPDDKLNSLAINQSVDGSILFVIGNGNYSSFQLVCRAESQQKPLFIVDLPNP
jgi:hypothetical protein